MEENKAGVERAMLLEWSGAVVFKVWSPGPCIGTPGNILRPHPPDVMTQKFLDWGPEIYALRSPLGDADTHPHWRTTDRLWHTNTPRSECPF